MAPSSKQDMLVTMQCLPIQKCRTPADVKEIPYSSAAGHPRQRAGAAETGRALVILCLLICPMALSGQLSSQETFRNLTGTVTDGHHEPLKGVVVEVENSANMTVVSYITGRSGTYSFKRLNGDTDYRVWATFHGQRSKVRQLSQFDSSNKPKIINFVIRER